MPNGAEATRRVDRGLARDDEPPFSEGQRIWLLERDLDVFSEDMAVMRKLITTRLNMIVGIGFSLLVAVVSVLVTVVASR